MQFLLPTAETALVNYHVNEILTEDELLGNISLIHLATEGKQEVIVQKKEE